MMHSQLPVPALLCALLMLPLGMPRGFSDVPLTDAEVQRALAFAMQQYNDGQYDIPNYFKQVRLVKAKSQTVVIYKLTVEVAKTACEKKTDNAMAYYKIQRCEELPGNQLTCCSFTVSSRRDMNLDIMMCYKENTTCPNAPRNVKCL